MSIQFEKVSFEQYLTARRANSKFLVSDEIIRNEYDNYIHLPKRATSGSAGYDICCPFSVAIGPDRTIIPTGIRVKLEPEDNRRLYLAVFPRSGLGFKYGVKLKNTTGIIDSDYYYADNEGHIMLALTAEKYCDIEAEDRVAQGIIQEYFVTDNDEATEKRTGGMGSTGT